MSEEDKKAKSKTAEREEEILKFWQENKIFEKSLEKESPKGEFVFYDGPPFATGLPHYGSLLSSIIKDVIPRYKTMRGFRVRRRWGWDTHGLPIESLVEKKLGLKTKKEIEQIGVAKFNEEARAMVLQYAHDWQKYVERVGRWVEFENAYKTMDNSYIESVWWALSEMNKKGLLYEGRKVLLYCPHCETPLAKAEIAMDNSYKDITEEAVTVKFKIKNPEKIGLRGDVFLLAWTTTPWTLPGNVALAVGEKIKYGLFEKDGESFVKADEGGRFSGKDLVGLEYEPLFDIPKIKESAQAYKVYAADFVNTEEGTGIVHTAVMYGEDDYNLGVKEGLPMVDLLDLGGKYNENAPEFLRGKYIKKAEAEIKEYLQTAKLLFDKKNNTHSYPHCYRCGTALIYNAVSSWFINIQKIKDKLLQLNENINWVPEHLKHGRFQNIIENAPDWTISRNRYWASPLPIWRNEKTGAIKVVGSLEELKKYTKKNGNKYFGIRHGEGEHNVLDIVSNDPDLPHHLTEKGKGQAKIAGEKLKKEKIDVIYCSPFVRTKETAEIIAEELGYPKEKIIYDDRIRELNFGDLHLKPFADFLKYEETSMPDFTDKLPNGESYQDAKNRVGDFIYDIDSKHRDKNILIVTHGMFLEVFPAVIAGADARQSKNFVDTVDPQMGEVYKYDFVPLPHNQNYELDLHKPYIDEIELCDEDGSKLIRVKEVVDCWLESGSMPFAEWHYPTENKEEFESRFPGDFIAEYIAQTRTWFYYMHVMSTALFDSASFRNVVTTGNVLAKDGTKMSKSKGNYTDPLANFDELGADALRLYMMGSVVMQAEDMSFRDEEYKEQHNRVINIFWNCLTFFKMYNDKNADLTKNFSVKTNILDRWIISRLNQSVTEITQAMENYDTVTASRGIKPFVDDFSTWYVRRSRDRFKSEDLQDKKDAMETTRFVLLTFSKLFAPIMPFLAESVYKELRAEADPESVHLCSWPEAGEVESQVLVDMAKVREIVSAALEKRNTAGIKVRQPLNNLKIKKQKSELSEEYIGLIKDEVNVKNVVFDDLISDEVELDTTITEDLKKEGQMREFVRAVQDLRKQKGLEPSDTIRLLVETDPEGRAFIESLSAEIKKPTNLSEIVFEKNDGEDLKIENLKLKIKIA